MWIKWICQHYYLIFENVILKIKYNTRYLLFEVYYFPAVACIVNKHKLNKGLGEVPNKSIKIQLKDNKTPQLQTHIKHKSPKDSHFHLDKHNINWQPKIRAALIKSEREWVPLYIKKYIANYMTQISHWRWFVRTVFHSSLILRAREWHENSSDSSLIFRLIMCPPTFAIYRLLVTFTVY